MTKLLDDALEMVRRLPPSDQDAVARTILALASGDDREAEHIDPAHLPAVLEGLREIERGEFATDQEVEAALRRFDP